ncbi:MAG: nitroreductase family protein [Clostridium sp.]|nr:nitroreductase family protein [Clostridium sp.]
METLHDLLVNRHSIRRYTPQQLTADQVKLILEAALLAPTSKSSRSWQFVVVDDQNTLESLSQCKPAGAAPVGRCPLAVVVCGDSRKSDPWIEDASIAAVFMQLQAEDLGLGSCWIQVRGRFTADGIPSEEYIQRLLDIPEEISVLCVVTFGHKDEQRKPVDTSRLLWEQVHIGKWDSGRGE